jgi:DNA modification methylase
MYGNISPDPFPEQLARDLIKSWSNEGDIILDIFCIGSTLKAAKKLNREFIGIGWEPYVLVSV